MVLTPDCFHPPSQQIPHVCGEEWIVSRLGVMLLFMSGPMWSVFIEFAAPGSVFPVSNPAALPIIEASSFGTFLTLSHQMN